MHTIAILEMVFIKKIGKLFKKLVCFFMSLIVANDTATDTAASYRVYGGNGEN